MQERKITPKHIVLTSHPNRFGSKPIPIFGKNNRVYVDCVSATLTNPVHRNVIGTPDGRLCSLPRLIFVASGALQSNHKSRAY